MTIPTSKTAAFRALTSMALFATPLMAGDACSQSGCCEKKDASSSFGITGDWFGLRSTLKENGYDVTGSYIAETFGNPRGGQKHGMVFDGLLKLALDVNLEKAVAWPDATFRISGLYPHGTSGTQGYVGDASVFSNIDSYDSYRLVDFWVEQKLLNGKVGIKLGQMRMDDEFGVTDTAAFLINATFGVPNPISTPMPLAIYPVGGLGIRLRVEPVEGLYGIGGIYDGNPSPGDFANPLTGQTSNVSRHGTDWALRDSEGTFYIGEIGYQRSGAYPGALRLGLMRHTSDFPDILGGASHSHSSSTYYVVDQTIWQKAKDSKEGVSVFIRGTMAPESTSYMSNTTQVGVVYAGLAKADDKVGVAYAHNKFSPGQRDTDSGMLKSYEAVTEISYQVPVTSYLKVQPDVQYISHPGGTTKNNNAWVLGVRAILEF